MIGIKSHTKPQPRPQSYVGSIVCTPQGYEGKLISRSTVDPNRYEVLFFNRHIWHWQRRWFDAGVLQLVQAA